MRSVRSLEAEDAEAPAEADGVERLEQKQTQLKKYQKTCHGLLQLSPLLLQLSPLLLQFLLQGFGSRGQSGIEVNQVAHHEEENGGGSEDHEHG